MTITVAGHKINVASFDEHFTCEQCDEIRTQIRKKFTPAEMTEELTKLSQKSTRTHNIINYYTRELLWDVKSEKYPLSMNDCLDSDDFLRHIKGQVDNDLYKISSNPKFSHFTLAQRMLQLLKLEGKNMRVAGNYPINSVKNVLSQHKGKNKVYYDYSCGWGNRLLGSMVSDFEYLGTDPNHKLVEKLKMMYNNFKQIKGSAKADIRCQGSEIVVPEWKNKVDIAFSSPPYFDLEDYQHGNQSIKDRNYTRWLEEYWKPTVINIKLYLKEDGLFLLNIKNTKEHALLDDMKKIAISCGFYYHYSDVLKTPTRPNVVARAGKISSDEEILVFSTLDVLDKSEATIKRLEEIEQAKIVDFNNRQKYYEEVYARHQEEIRIKKEYEDSLVTVDTNEWKKTIKSMKKYKKRKRVKAVPPSKQ